MQDPFASLSVLPCSSVTIAANLSRLASRIALKRNKMRARCKAGVWLQDCRAVVADATAWLTSDDPAKKTLRNSSPVAGLWMADV